MREGTNDLYEAPTRDGHFGRYGGRFVAETLFHALDQLDALYQELKEIPIFDVSSRRTSRSTSAARRRCIAAERLTRELGGAQIFLKREDLNHTGAHKINNTVGQALLAKRIGKRRIIAETGAGQHGVATATVAARLGLKCQVYMGSEDIKRQSLNVYRMKLLGAEVVPVTSGSRTLKDAMNEAMRDWVTNVDDTHYIIGTVAGPHPYPMMVRDFQSVIGQEARAQCLQQTGRLPDTLVACVGGGSNAIGLFYPFVDDSSVRFVGVEAAGLGARDWKACSDAVGRNARRAAWEPHVPVGRRRWPDHRNALDFGRPRLSGCRPGARLSSKISAAPTTCRLPTPQALSAFRFVTQVEGIMPALESSHALAWVREYAPRAPRDEIIIVNLSGRGDKDIMTVAAIDEIAL